MGRKLGIMIAIVLMMGWIPLSVGAETGVSAQSAIVMEQTTGRVLYEKAAEEPLPMASTTKIMTAICALEMGNLEEKIEISSTAAAVEGSSMYLEAGEVMTLRELLYGLMLPSGNDAAVAIAEHLGGMEQFVNAMNQKAQVLGMTQTRFANPNGLPAEEHYASARDMARMTAYGLQNPEFVAIVGSKSYRIEGEGKAYSRTLTNHNKLLKLMPDCIGVKTGFTKAAGRCLVSAVKRNEMTLICVTLNAPDDWNDHQSLYQHCFEAYQLRPVLRCGTLLDTIEVEESETQSLPVTAGQEVFYPLRLEEQCTVTVTLAPPLQAPVQDAAVCGQITVALGDQIIKEIPAITAGSAQRLPLLKRPAGFLHRLSEFFSQLLGI